MNKRNVGRFYIIIGLMCFILNGCDPKHDVEKITDYDKTESTEKVSEKLETVGTEAVSETVTEITENIPEKQNMQEPEWQMSSEEKDAFKMILLGTYLDDIESNTLSLEKNRKSKELDNVDKYSFLINFRKGGNGDSLELLYNVQEWYMIVSEEQANDILKSAYGDGFQEDMYTVLTKIVGNGMEGDYDEYIMNGGAYITPLGDNMYNIFNADDGDTEYKIEIKQAEMLNKEQCNVNAFIDIDVANERFQRYSVNAIFNKNEDSIFAGYTLDSSTLTKVDVGMLDWKEAYKKALFCRMLDDGTYFYSECFALHDFDNDGIPELLLPVYPSDKGWYAEDMWSNSDIWNESYTWQGGLIARYDNDRTIQQRC